MISRLARLQLTILLFCLAILAGRSESVKGRYIYYGNALSEKMGLVEVEVYSGGENILRDRRDVFTHGLQYGYWMIKRTPDQQGHMARHLTDGNTDTTERKVDFGSKIGGGYGDLALRNTSLGIDLGEEMPIEKIGIYRGRWESKQHKDLGYRILVVLNEKREIVAWNAFNVYGDGWRKGKGVWMLDIEPATGPLAGRVVPAGARCWLSEAEYIRDCLGKPVVDLVDEITPELQARLERYERRNKPDEIAALGREFFARVDLDNPDLAEVKALVVAGQYAEALEAFKEPFIAKLEPLKYWHQGQGHSIYVFYSWSDEKDTRSELRARDLRHHIFGDREDMVVKRFRPGTLPPAKIQFPFQTRPLLLNYAVNGNKEDLRLWESLTDDWAMGFQEAADQDPLKLRDHFVLNIGLLPSTCKDFYNASVTNPDFINDVSGATLARMLLPMLEELPVSYWRVTRKCVFNHNFNAMGGAYRTLNVLPYFLAVKRLKQETQQAIQRLHTYGLYRDGEMIEIGDEGHFVMPICSPGYIYGQMTHDKPAWFDPAMETYYLDHFRQAVLAGVRHVSPSGISTRWGNGRVELGYLGYYLGTVDPYWRNVAAGRMHYEDGTPLDYDTYLAQMIMKEPTSRAIVDTVFGRARTFEERRNLKDQEALAEIYPGEYEGEPPFLSDWMPYAGLHYFRSSWERQGAFLHMVTPSNPNSMDGGNIGYNLTRAWSNSVRQFAPTSYRFYDYETPILTGHGVLIDGLPSCPQEDRFPSGSKQDSFTQGVEKPQDGRWFSDELFDFGEAGFRGSFRDMGFGWDNEAKKTYLDIGEIRIEDVDTQRQIFQVRPARLFLQVDRIRFAEPGETHTASVKSTLITTAAEGEPSLDQVQLHADQHRVELRNPDNAGGTVAWFGQSDLDFTLSGSANHPDLPRLGGPTMTLAGECHTLGREVTASWSAQEQTVLLSLVRGLAPETEPFASLEDISTDAVAGLKATMKDGVTVTLLVARNIPSDLAAGRISIEGEALLLCEQPGQPQMGLVLGALDVEVDGRGSSADGDFRFTIGEPRTFLGFIPRAAELSPVPVRRPIDPPTIGPADSTFTESMKVTITSETPGMDIYYLAESMDEPEIPGLQGGLTRASINATNWQRYDGPFEIDESTFVRAYAQRPGTAKEAFLANGTDTTLISYARFTKEAVRPAVATPVDLQPGLNYDYLEERWFALWTYTDQLAPVSIGTTDTLLDVSMRQTDGPFGVRYHGYIDVPKSGIYTFYGPEEYTQNIAEPGYDLRVFVDGEEWYLGQMWHGLGQWQIPLEKGLHTFRVTFADARAKELENQRIDLWRHYPWAETTWKGKAPVLEVSGPGLDRQPLPNAWLKRARPTHTINTYNKLERQAQTLSYKTVGDRDLRVLVMQPTERARDERRPAIVWIHGGGWRSGSPEQFLPQMRYTVARGAVAFSVEYRLQQGKSPTIDIADCVADCADAIAWIRAHADELGVDPQRISVIGDSSGAHLALCLGTLPLPAASQANAVVSCSGMADLVTGKWRSSILPGVDADSRAHAVSPIRHLSADDAPVLILHGGLDSVVPPTYAEALHAACQQAGVDSELLLWPDASHAFILANYTATDTQISRALLATDAFLTRHGLLDGPPALHAQHKGTHVHGR